MKGKYDLIIMGGAPGSGKSTVLEIVKAKLENPWIDYGWLRNFHLNYGWKNANSKERAMTFENAIFIIKNYMKRGYKNIMIDDLQYDKAVKLTKLFARKKILFVILTCDEKELTKRVSSIRESGFKNVKEALYYNKQWTNSKIKGSIKIDNSHNNPKKTADMVLKHIKN
jgi:predicted kinase